VSFFSRALTNLSNLSIIKDMKKLVLFCVATLVLQSPAFANGAQTWKEKCPTLKECIEAFSDLTGEQYLFQPDAVKGAVGFTNNIPFEKEDGDLIFTNVLYQNGRARVLLKPNVYEIMNISDAKGKDLPRVECDQRKAPVLPNTYDLLTLEYKFTNKGIAKDSENVIRTYAEMGARIYGVGVNDSILITDFARNLGKIYHMLVSLDAKPTPEYLAKQKAREAAQLKSIENGNAGGHPNQPDKPVKKEDHKP